MRLRTRRRAMVVPRTVCACALLVGGAQAQAQSPADTSGWSQPEATALVEQADARRASVFREREGLQDYRARAEGYVYFFVDLTEEAERVLIRTDQVALDLAWRAPDLTKQRLVGRRFEEEMPTRLRYYRDRLVTVMDNFGDRIMIADGENVDDVVHPVSREGLRHYEYRIVDSVSVHLPGFDGPVRIHEVAVRPRDRGAAGVVGSIFLEERNADIVRMRFTFTPAAYTDPQVDRIHVTLEHALWEGRYWLPHEQRLEVRRELQGLDLPAGTIIRARMRIRDYQLNTGIPLAHFAGPPVVAVPEERQEAHEFEQPLHAELAAEGLAPDPDVDALEERAREIARERALSGVRGGRFSLPSASDVFRFNRAEGAVFGAGLSRGIGAWTARGHAGWALGPQRPWGFVELSSSRWGGRLRLRAFARDPADAGGIPVAAGIVSTLTAIGGGEDLVDPYYRHGAAASFSFGRPSLLGLRLRGELARHQSAEQTVWHSPAGHRPLRPLAASDDGWLAAAAARIDHAPPPASAGGWDLSIGATLGRWWDGDAAPKTFVQPEMRFGWSRDWRDGRNTAAEAGIRTGASFGVLPRQSLFLVGGRGTAPGHPFRAWGGDRFAAAHAVIGTDLAGPWIRGRAVAGVGWSGAGAAGAEALAALPAEPTGRARAGAGIGVGLLHDVLHVDLVRGLGRTGRWEVILGTRREFWGFL